ncbi:MAG: hypothetical protein PUG85_00610 [Oscillospiraceae bacterium]|nr:hypothetical protein [Oscillospiraceae bacterium]
MFGVLWETLSEPSGRFASLSACAAVRPILYSRSLTDCNSFALLRGTACSPYLEDALPLCRLRRHSCPTLLSASLTFSHAVGNHPHCGESPLAELSQLDRSSPFGG